jgi:uncharacterized SAM-binding protein YcdF (DUF218 family)
MRLLFALVMIAFVAPLAAIYLLFLSPPTTVPEQVDAVVMLAGGQGERLETAVDLAERGTAPVLVLSHGPSTLCGGGRPFEVVCFVPEPGTTVGEAREIGQLVAQHGWQDIAVVTSTHHVARSRTVVGQCTEADVHMVDAGSAEFTREQRGRIILHEFTGLVAALTVEPAC